MAKRIYIDTETTGLHHTEDEILQIAICDDYGEQLWSEYYRPVRHESWDDATRVNGIFPSDVADCRTLSEAVPEIQRIIDSARVVFAYNAAFDLPFLEDAGLDFGRVTTRCTMLEYAEYNGQPSTHHQGEYRWQKLVTAARRCGYSYKPHDALEDARAAAAVQVYMEKHPIPGKVIRCEYKCRTQMGSYKLGKMLGKLLNRG